MINPTFKINTMMELFDIIKKKVINLWLERDNNETQ